MDIDPHPLPNDPGALRQMVLGLLEEAAEQERRLKQLQHWVEHRLRARYGPRRERVSENQLFLFAVALASAGQESRPDPESPTARTVSGYSTSCWAALPTRARAPLLHSRFRAIQGDISDCASRCSGGL